MNGGARIVHRDLRRGAPRQGEGWPATSPDGAMADSIWSLNLAVVALGCHAVAYDVQGDVQRGPLWQSQPDAAVGSRKCRRRC